MSRYIAQAISNSYPLNNGTSSDTTITVASAQQPPALGTPDEVKETARVVVENYNGGMSFSIAECWRRARDAEDIANRSDATQHLVTLVERLAIFGTSDTRVDVSASKLTAESRDLFYELARADLSTLVQTIRSVYEQNRAPKVTHVVYLTALLTSATIEAAMSDQMMVDLRSKGYGLVPMFRMTTHLFEWINTHISLCSLHAKGLKDTDVAKAPGLVFPQRVVRGHKTSAKTSKPPKLARAGGTGAGFRKAVEAWYLARCAKPEDAMNLCIQVVKYSNRVSYTHKDVLSLIHIKMTSREKCGCKVKSACNCPPPEPHELRNVIPVAGQIPLAYAVHGLDHAAKVLADGVVRLEHFGGDPEKDPDILHAFKALAFLCAVEKAKIEDTDAETVCRYIRLFRLTREMVSNTKLSDIGVSWDLLVKSRFNPSELRSAQRLLLLEKTLLHTLVNNLFADVEEQEQKEQKESKTSELQIGAPATALVRNLNKLDKLVTRDQNPRADELIAALVKHLTNKDVLEKGLLHPINLFNAWAVYSRGRGHLGSMSWTPVEAISQALLDATELSFKGLNGFDFPIAFMMDASASMSQEGSAPGMPCLKALDIAVLLLLTMYRASALTAEKNGKPMPNHLVGYFGGSSCGSYGKSSLLGYGFGGSTGQTVNKMITDQELKERCDPFMDVTNKFTARTSFKNAKEALGNGAHLGMTDVSSALWTLIQKLRNSVSQVKAGNRLFKNLTVHQLPGFYELLVFITDNDVNSGDQPMDVLNLYWGLVRQAFQLIPLDKDRKKTDPEMLYIKYMPRMVVVATQGGNLTIGDPRDDRILNVCGFDSSAPVLIDAFVNKNAIPLVQTDENDD